MPQPTGHPESPGTLPRPELNPLLNALLSENLGRWAEVYITTPPEKREEAIRELVRELEAKPVSSHTKQNVPTPGTETPTPVATLPIAHTRFAELRTRRALAVAAALVLFTLGYFLSVGRERRPSAQPRTIPQPLPAPAPASGSQTPPTTDSLKKPASLPPAPITGNSQESSIDGSRELAIARDYLNGTNGKPHDSEEAMPWLWKAVARQNGSATLLLAERYALGDGVGKNCDQARVLLDAAARKKAPGAEQLLRHLATSDCP